MGELPDLGTFFSTSPTQILLSSLSQPKILPLVDIWECEKVADQPASGHEDMLKRPFIRNGLAARILEIIRYSPFFNFEYNLLTLYNFVSMHFFPKIFIQQLVSLLAFNAKKYSKIVNTLQTVEISFCQKFQLWVTDEIWSFKLNLCTTTTTVHFYQDKFGQIWWYFSLRKIPQQNLVKYSDRSGWNFPVYI